MPRPHAKNQGLKEPESPCNIKYMHRPPIISPNYDTLKKAALPKSKVSRVLLYDNATQGHMLGIKLAHINVEQDRTTRLLNLNKRTFFARQKRRHKHLIDISTKTDSLPGIHSIAKTENNNGKTNSIQDHIKEHDAQANSSINFKMDDLKLPDIREQKKHVILQVQNSDGETEIYHTIDDGDLFQGFVPLHSFYSKTTDDPRFKRLANILVPLKQSTFIY